MKLKLAVKRNGGRLPTTNLIVLIYFGKQIFMLRSGGIDEAFRTAANRTKGRGRYDGRWEIVEKKGYFGLPS